MDDRIGGLTTALRATESAGIDIDDMALRTPNLDEVFLTLTGKPPDANPGSAEDARHEEVQP